MDRQSTASARRRGPRSASSCQPGGTPGECASPAAASGRDPVQPMQLLDSMPWLSALRLGAFGVALGIAQPVLGQIDLAEVELSVAIRRVNDAGTTSQVTILARLVVRGSGITAATITPPGGVPLSLVGGTTGELVREQSFTDESVFAAALPDGDYLLDLNGGEATAALAYARPAVPSPAISSPSQGSVVPAGPVEIRFEPCAICVQSGDSTVATLEQGGTPLASESLPSTVAAWTPSDATGLLALPPSSSFTARVTHTASRSFALAADPPDPFAFGIVLSDADEIVFSTGFLAPEAAVCIVVNDRDLLDPEKPCVVHEDPNDAIFDTSAGGLETTAAGVRILYGFSASPRGRLSGIADLDLDQDGSFETHVPVVGRLSGRGGQLRQSLRIGVASSPPAPEAKLKLKIRERTDTATLVRTRVQTARGRLLGARVRETTSTTEEVEEAPRGWRLDFQISGAQGEISDARLTLSDGRTVTLSGRHRFLIDVNRTNARLKSGGADRGAQIEIDTLALDATGSVVRGELRYRAFGQRGTIRFR